MTCEVNGESMTLFTQTRTEGLVQNIFRKNMLFKHVKPQGSLEDLLVIP